MENIGWWYDQKYYHNIDTILSWNGTLISKLLPGQGKILKVEFLSLFDYECDACETVNNFEDLTFSLEQITDCCFKLKLNYDINCNFDDLDYRLLVKGNGNNGLTFKGNAVADSLDEGKYLVKDKMDLDSNSTFLEIGTVCLPDNGEEYTIEFMVGRDTLGRFTACDRKIKFKAECDSEPKDCCDSVEIISEYSEWTIGGFTQGCCNDFRITGFNPNNCIYNIDLKIANVIKKRLVESDTALYYSGVDSTLIGSWCIPMAVCRHDGEGTPPPTLVVPAQIEFKDEEGTIICSKPVDVEICCYWSLEELLDIDSEDLVAGKRIIENNFLEAISEEADNYVYPNPNTGNFTINYRSLFEEKVDIKIFSLSGGLVSNLEDIQLNVGTNAIPINNLKLTSGYYFVLITGTDGTESIPFIVE